jgi:DNA-binding transcriptional ArsR family regulator
MYSSHPTITVDGTARLPNMTGTVTVTDKEATTTHSLDGQDLTVAGRFRFTPVAGDADGKGTTVEGTGDYTTVAYGVVDAHYDWATTIAAVGLGAAVLAAIGWVALNGKTLLGIGGSGLIAGYARVHGDEILEHPGRAEVYERVKAFPGVNFVQLSEQVDFGTSTLNYHLRVLEKNGFVTSVRDGRYLRFFDRKSGHYSNQKKFQVSALRNHRAAHPRQPRSRPMRPCHDVRRHCKHHHVAHQPLGAAGACHEGPRRAPHPLLRRRVVGEPAGGRAGAPGRSAAGAAHHRGSSGVASLVPAARLRPHTFRTAQRGDVAWRSVGARPGRPPCCLHRPSPRASEWPWPRTKCQARALPRP